MHMNTTRSAICQSGRLAVSFPTRSISLFHPASQQTPLHYRAYRRSRRFGTSQRAVTCSAAAPAAATAAATTLLGASPWGIWAALACAGAAGLQLERTKWGKEMSGALLSTLIGLALSNLGVIPSEAPHVYGVVNGYLLPLAVPLLLFAADLRRVIGDTGRLLTAFIGGAIATVVGSFAAFSLMPLHVLGADGWKVAGALTARHIGGSVNYVAVSEVLNLSPGPRMAGLAADDVIVSIYFIILYALARRTQPDAPSSSSSTTTTSSSSANTSQEESHIDDRRTVTVVNGATAIAVSACICALGTHLANSIGYRGGSITVITAITVTIATLVPKMVAPLTASGEGLAAILMQLFFASVGASGNIGEVLRTAPTLFAWSAVAISVHVALVLLWERVFKFTRRETCLASNANIGGPTTAAGMAAAKGWRSSMVPALLIGIFGYATATFIGVGAAQIFKRMQLMAI
jgi:uncharacterized membrane protein